MRLKRFLAFHLVLLLAVIGMIGQSGSGSAHLPTYEAGGSSISTAMKIPDANVSYAIYAEYADATNRIHFYAFSVEAGHLLNFLVGVPAIGGLGDFAPVVILLGPGLQSPDNYTSGLLSEFSVALPPGNGAMSWVYVGTEDVKEFEPFTQTDLWVRQDTEVILPSQGVYYLAVAVPLGSTQDATSGFGKYVLAPGVLEQFSLLDFMTIPVVWVKTHVFWDQSILVMMIPTILTVVLGTGSTWYIAERRAGSTISSLPRNLRSIFYVGIIGGMLMIGTCINQLIFVFGYTEFSPGGADLFVIVLQSIGLILGIAAARQVPRFTKTAPWTFLAIPAAIAFFALAVGSGFIVGPVLFLAAIVSEHIIVWRRA
jgi:hypothetical protein